MRTTKGVVRACAAVTGMVLVTAASAEQITVKVDSLAPSGGIYIAPMWVGFHDGSFDAFDVGVAATPGGRIERLAEDGTSAPLSADFQASPAGVAGGIDATITSPGGFPGLPVFDPGESASMNFNLTPSLHRYFSYAAMVVPSNDAFIGNDNPTGIELFDAGGNFVGPVSFVVMGSMIWDAGTEANTEMEAAFINQTGPNMGTTTADPIAQHPGYIGSLNGPAGTPIILGGTTVAGTVVDPVLGDFTRPGFQLARITITPEPGALILMAIGGAACLRRRRPV